MATKLSLDPIGPPRVGVPVGVVGELALALLGEPGGVAYSSGSSSSSKSSIDRGRRTMELQREEQRPGQHTSWQQPVRGRTAYL